MHQLTSLHMPSTMGYNTLESRIISWRVGTAARFPARSRLRQGTPPVGFARRASSRRHLPATLACQAAIAVIFFQRHYCAARCSPMSYQIGGRHSALCRARHGHCRVMRPRHEHGLCHDFDILMQAYIKVPFRHESYQPPGMASRISSFSHIAFSAQSPGDDDIADIARIRAT